MNLATQEFENFLYQHASKVSNFTNMPLKDTGLTHEYDQYPLRLTQFEDLYDTLLYSKLIRQALELGGRRTILMDMGAGSSIPSLLATKNSEIKPLQVIAVDIDEEAEAAGQYNAKILGLESIYSFVRMTIEDALDRALNSHVPLTIVSNPPYIATPSDMNDPHFRPINGGEDGTRFMLEILQRPYPSGTIVALLWGSLTCPEKILREITNHYEVMDVQAMKVHFGRYTSHPQLKEYLYKLRDEGKVFFVGDRDREEQIVVGTILRKK